MMTRGAALHGAVVSVIALVLLESTSASARPSGSEQRACVEAAERAQTLRDGGKYKLAREQLVTCVRDVCPALIRHDCGEWLGQIESLAPTVVLAAKEGPRDLVDVKVTIDGVLATDKLDGQPLPTDPGPHVFQFEWSGQTKEEQVVISAGQKGRNIVASFDAPLAAASPPDTRAGERSRLPAYVVGGVGLAGVASFAIFAVSGRSAFNHLEETCKPTCSHDEVAAVREKFILGDISLGLGVVALGVSTYLFLRPPSADVVKKEAGLRSIEWHVAPTFGGAAGSIGGRF